MSDRDRIEKELKTNWKRIKVQRENGNKSPNREIKVQKENGKSRCDVKKEVIPKTTM